MNRTIIFYVIGLVLFFGIHHLGGQNSFKVTTISNEVRIRLGLDEFYKKHLKLEGFSIIGSAKVSDFALKEAAFLIRKIVGNRNELLTLLNKNKVRFVVMARDEYTTDVPEHSDLKPTKYWNRRARGLGATFARPAVSCGEENLLGLPGDPYAKENILIHEFAHALHQMALIQLDNSFQNQIDECFKNSIKHNIWEGTYASTNVNEYWAEGVQSWFNTNRENDRDHAWINTREELKKADPQLANLIEKTLGNSEWRYQLPRNRNPQTPHLNGFQSNNETPFSWPKDLVQWFADYESGKIGLAPKGSPNIKPVSIDSKLVQKSQHSRKRTQLYFRNLSDKAIFLEWIDFQGMSKQRRTIRPHDQLEINSFVGHIWQVIDKISGKKILRFILPESKTSKFSFRGF